MRAVLVLGFVLTSVLGEHQLNLEDIERDNIQAERKSGPDHTKSSYSVKPETDREDYQPSDSNYSSGAGLGSYSTSQPDVESYGNLHTRYQQIHPKSLPAYQSHYYEPEISVGNQYQTIQQKAASEKYLKSGYKNTVYIPMSQLLAYYPQLALGQGSPSKSESLLEELTSPGAARQLSRPVYTPNSQTRANVYPYEIQPQYVTYATKYPLHTQAILPLKKTGGRLYSQIGRAYTQPKELVYTHVISQPQHQYLPQFIYPTSTVYSQRPSHSPQYSQYIQPGKVEYVSTNIAQDYEKSQESSEHLTPPQLPAEDFKSGQYHSIPEESDDKVQHYVQNHIHHSEPKSLLDSYIPSHIIAAQDAERYRERPIKLESGFLPSKINFIHSYKKRKAE